jgi:hypothetical protein
MIEQILTQDLKLKDVPIHISKFATECGVTQQYILLLILSLLARTAEEQFKLIHKKYGLDTIQLGWYLYHDVPFETQIFSVTDKQTRKKTDIKRCAICHARKNIVMQSGYRCTISPEVMSGGRARMSWEGHFVVWAMTHDGMVEEDVDGVNDFFRHGTNTYGHDHVHVIRGSMFDIRAEEGLRRVVQCISRGDSFDRSDFFHPLDKYMNRCSARGRDCVIATFILSVLRLDIKSLNLDTDTIITFLKFTYNTYWHELMNIATG